MVTVALLVEARVVFRDPDVLEVDNQLFIVDETNEDEFRMLLSDMIAQDKGNFTHWLNMDHAEMLMGSTGDYEWLMEVRNRQRIYGDCIVPCDTADIFAMEIDILGTEEDFFILENCVDLEAEARRPKVGFFCMNYDQRRPQSKCQQDERCKQYMTSRCQCPDFEVRYFCATTSAARQQYCDAVEAQYASNVGSRKRSYEALLSNFNHDNAQVEVAKVKPVLEGKPVEEKSNEGKDVKQMLRDLIEKFAKEQN